MPEKVLLTDPLCLFVMIVIISAALATFGLLFLLVPFLRRRLLDHPNARSSHSEPTPRGGGLAFVIVVISSSAIRLLAGITAQQGRFDDGLIMVAMPLLVLPLVIVSYLDDRHNIPVISRYFVQLFTVLVLCLVSPLVPLSMSFLPLLVLIAISATAVINFTNFMDGLDGLPARR